MPATLQDTSQPHSATCVQGDSAFCNFVLGPELRQDSVLWVGPVVKVLPCCVLDAHFLVPGMCRIDVVVDQI